MLAIRLAFRELRGGVRGLRIVLACLALGVAIIAGVGTLRAATDRGLATDGRRILGGDLDIDGGAQPLPASLREWLDARGARWSDVVRMRSMLIAPGGERLLVELKAVDRAWPLVGAAEVVPAMPVPDALAGQGLLAERVVLDRLGLKPGDRVRLGNTAFTVRGELKVEPDRVATPSIMGPRVLISTDALAATGLIAPGAMVQHALRLLDPPGRDTASFAAELHGAFAAQGWRIRDPSAAAPGIGPFIDRTGQFMTLVGLSALLVGGIGVANGVSAWLEARARSIAILRCLGASAGTVFAVSLVQVMALSVLGVLIGLLAGAVLPFAATTLLAGLLPAPPVAGVYPVPLAQGALYGLLTAAAFSMIPLGRAMRIPGAALFRDGLLPERARPPGAVLAVTAVLAAALVALTVFTTTDRMLSLIFCAAALGTLVLFQLGGMALMAAARAMPRASAPWLRLGLGNLYRPGAATPLVLVSVGLGLSTLAAVALIEGNMRREILDQMPSNAPSFFFVDIQRDQLAQFEAQIAGRPGVAALHEVPSLRARVVAVNGVAVDRLRVSPDTQWALRGDRGLTYAATPPDGTQLIAGSWWPADYHGKPLVSFDAGLARGWGVGLGDVIRVNVLGRDIDLTIASLRDIAWRTLSINFAMVASPGFLDGAPHTYIATVRVAPEQQAALLRAVTDALPNVTGIRVEDVLRAVAELLDRIATALAATGSVTLLSGALVLIGAVAAGQRRRMRDAVILKTLGATGAQVRAAWMVEFGILGLAAGILAAAVGTAASYGVARYVMHTGWVFLPQTLFVTLALCIVAMLVVGFAGTESALRAKAAPWLRNE
jgi:putative ABC transport system permease protein